MEKWKRGRDGDDVVLRLDGEGEGAEPVRGEGVAVRAERGRVEGQQQPQQRVQPRGGAPAGERHQWQPGGVVGDDVERAEIAAVGGGGGGLGGIGGIGGIGGAESVALEELQQEEQRELAVEALARQQQPRQLAQHCG